MYTKEKEICPDNISEINPNCEKPIILLMILNEEKEGCHYLVLQQKKSSAWLHGINAKRKGDCYYLNCLYSFRTENKLKSHKKVCQKRFLWNFNAIWKG